MFCPNCGAELKDGSKFCPNCGEKLDRPTTKVQTTKTEKVETQKPAKAPKAANSELLKKPIRVFKSIIIPTSIVAASFSALSILLLVIAWMCGDPLSSSGGTILSNTAMIFGIIAWVLILLITILQTVHTVFLCVRIRKPWLKNELVPAIINGVLTVLQFIFLIVLSSNLFSYFANHSFVLASSFAVVTVLLMFNAMWCGKLKKAEGNYNLWTLKSIGKTAIFSIIFVMIFMILSCFGGFLSPSSSSNYYCMWVSSIVCQRFIMGCFAILFALMLLAIPSIILGVSEGKAKRIVLWSIFAGMTFTFFLIMAIMLKAPSYVPDYSLKSTITDFCYYNPIVCTLITILSSFWLIPCGIVLSNSAKGLLKSAK